MTAPLAVGEVDAALAGHGAACDRMAERLVLLDGHHGQRLLDGARLTPANRSRWAAAKTTLADVWACFETYRDALAAARELRARRPRPSTEDLTRLTAVLRDRTFTLPAEPSTAAGGPRLADAGAGPAAGASRPAPLSLDELAARMEAGYAQVSSLVAEAVAGWTALAARLDPLTAAATAAGDSAAELGLAGGAELAWVAAELAALRGADPLAIAAGAPPGDTGAGPDGTGGPLPPAGEGGALGDPGSALGDRGDAPLHQRVDVVAARLRTVTDRLAAASQLRADYPRRRAALLARLSELDRAHADAVALAETVRAKIASVPPEPALDGASAGGPPPGDRGRDDTARGGSTADAWTGGGWPDRLRAGLAELDGCHDRGEWLVLAERVAGLDGRITEVAAAVAAAAGRLGGLLDRRAELRGRLDAYRAKAGQLGHAEDAALAGLYRAARELLWTAPCDLAVATRAVGSYQGEQDRARRQRCTSRRVAPLMFEGWPCVSAKGAAGPSRTVSATCAGSPRRRRTLPRHR